MARSSFFSVFSSRARRKRIAWSLLMALAVAVVLTTLLDSKSSSAAVRGDFPAFYSLAVIAASDNPQQLYDLGEQTRIQNEAWPDMKGSVLPAAYPPYVAYLTQPFVIFGPFGGKVFLTLVSLTAFFVATFLLSRLSATLQGATVELSVVLLLFAPVLMGVIGGQLLAVSMFVYVLMLVLDRQRGATSEILLGMVTGAWLFKPHYALLALLMFLVQGRLRVVIGFTVPALIYYALGVHVLGPGWLSHWMLFTREFAEMNYASNAAQMSNIVGVTLVLSQLFQSGSEMTFFSRAMAVSICGLIVLGLTLVAWRDRKCMPDRNGLPARSLLLLGPILAFATPQANFYDLGLAVIPLVILLRPSMRDWVLQFGACITCGFIAMSMKGSHEPLFAILALALLVVVGNRVLFVSNNECEERLVIRTD